MEKGRIIEIELDYDVPASTEWESDPGDSNIVDANGHIKKIEIHWPSGCKDLVGVQVGINRRQICPRNGELAMGSQRAGYDFWEPVKQGQYIWAKVANRDAVNSHHITITVMIEEDINGN